MTKLILVKHSLPAIDPSVPAAMWQLATEGIRRCGCLADALTPYLPATLVCSTESKAQATATYLATRWSIPCTAVAGLEEHHRRTAPFLGEAVFHQAIQHFFAQPAERVFGEETADAAYMRFATALGALLEQYPLQNLLVVTHGTVISLYLSRQVGIEPFPLWAQLGLPSFVVVDRATHTVETAMMSMI